MVYDGRGCIVQWIMVTDGSVLTDQVTMTGEHDVMFLKSETGMLTSVVVRNTMIAIKRLMIMMKFFNVFTNTLFLE